MALGRSAFKLSWLALGAGMFVALSGGLASATPALAISNTNLRQGPGTNFGVLATIPGGTTVDVRRCTGEWCTVTFGGRIGYAIARNLDLGGGSELAPLPAPPAPVYYRPVPLGIYPPISYWGPGYYWGPRYGWRRWW
jgi:uncharacterized protein YraI